MDPSRQSSEMAAIVRQMRFMALYLGIASDDLELASPVPAPDVLEALRRRVDGIVTAVSWIVSFDDAQPGLRLPMTDGAEPVAAPDTAA